MFNFLIKSGLGFIIFLLTLLGGMLPLIWKSSGNKERSFVFCGEYFSRGIFFGGGLIHMLPDAQNKFAQVMPDVHYAIIPTIAAFTIYILQFTEQGLTRLFKLNHHLSESWSTYMLAILISIHSVILGATLGVEDDLASTMVVFFAIIAHKMAESYALGINLRGSTIAHDACIKIMLLFGFMTPFGIILGTGLQSFLRANTGHIIESLFQAVAAGTFLYIATLNHIDVNDHHGTISRLSKIHSLGLGILLMAVLAIWL